MQAAFKAGGDFHSRTALGMYQEIKDAMNEGKCLLEYGSEGYDEEQGGEKPPLVKDMFASERRKAKVRRRISILFLVFSFFFCTFPT